MHRLDDDRVATSDLWLLPVRDFLIGWVWFRSFFTSHVTWRGNEFAVDADGTPTVLGARFVVRLPAM